VITWNRDETNWNFKALKIEWQGVRGRGAQATSDMLEAFGALAQRRAGG